MKIIVFVCSMILATSAYAVPKQLDIIGLVPGVSTQEQIGKNEDEVDTYEIGGYKLQCAVGYIDGVLSLFMCGSGRNSLNIADSLVSNIEVHATLVKGFTNKFGKPSKIYNKTLTNGFGKKFNSNVTIWIDKKGNKLTLKSRVNYIDTGLVQLESAQFIKNYEAEVKAAEKQRKF